MKINMQKKSSNVKSLLLFTVILAVISALYVIFTPQTSAISHNSWRHEAGEMAGGALSWLFAIIYGRTILKILVRNGPLLERLLPESTINSTSIMKRVIKFLNQSHPYVGAAAVIMVFVHALIEDLSRANLLMEAILILTVWQFVFGVFLLNRYQAVFVKKIKRYGYMAHSQLYTGIALGVFALFGHLLVDG